MHDTDATTITSRRSKSRARRGQSQPVDLVVDRRFFFYVKVRRRNVRLGLVVIVIGDKILDRVLRKKCLEFLIKLGRKRLVMGQNKRRPLDLLDHVRDRERLAAARDAEQHLVLCAVVQALNQLLDRLRLVTRGLCFQK